VPGFRETAAHHVATARQHAKAGDARLAGIAHRLHDEAADGVLAAFLEDVQAYVAFNLRRATRLEEMSAEFVQTKAGLQHATHLYEGEGKVLGLLLMEIVHKHHGAVEAPSLDSSLSRFVTTAQAIEHAYANRIIGF